MRGLITIIAMLLVSIAIAYEISINPVGSYRIQINGEIAEGIYDDYNSALESSLEISLQCADCEILIVQPPVSVSTLEIVESPPVIHPPEPEKLTAYYSHQIDADGSFVDPQPIDGAVLRPVDVYVEWRGSGLEKVSSWCCKAPGGDFDWQDIDKTGDVNFTLNLSRHADSTESLELYSDVTIDGKTDWGVKNYFTIEQSEPPIIPPIVEPPVDDNDEIVMTWNEPTERVDGTPVNGISGYIVEIDNGGDPTIFAANTTEFTIKKAALGPGRWNFRVQAIDTTPSNPCPPDVADDLIYSCGGPLSSAFSDPVSVVID